MESVPVSRSCPALMISSIASGQGKTTITAALAAYFTQQGKCVRVFKCGPDFIDPTILEKASHHRVYQLDLWMVGEQACQQLLFDAAQNADLILIEGVMGLFDGNPSTADLAKFFGIPVLAVINASAMAQTFGALVSGLNGYDAHLNIAGVIANQVNSVGHSQLLEQSIKENIAYCGAMPTEAKIKLPERHLGLQLAHELINLDQQLTLAGELVEKHLRVPLPPVVFSEQRKPELPGSLNRVRIGVARDQAFCFIYQANLDLLIELGAELIFFSPCSDALPGVDSLYLPGGYPELFAEKLAGNHLLKQQIKQHYLDEKPIVAECGGLMFLVKTLVDFDQQAHDMVGLIDTTCVMQKKLTAIGLQQGNFFGEILRGHTFHFSSLMFAEEDNTEYAIYPSVNHSVSRQGEIIFQQKRLTASYVHWYFPSHPDVVVQLLKPIENRETL